MKKFLIVVLAVLLLLTTFIGCSNSAVKSSNQATTATTAATATAAASGKTETDYNKTGTLNLDWYTGVSTDLLECPWENQQSLYEEMVFSSLVKLDTDGTTIIGDLAKSWEISPDASVYSFTIRDDAKWQDGQPVTIDDVLFSIEGAQKVTNTSGNVYFNGIKGVQDFKDGKTNSISGVAVSGNTITITLSAPDSTFLASALCNFYILPKHLLKDVDPIKLNKDTKFWSHPIGSGMYKVDQVSAPNYFTLVKNDSYYGEPGKIEKVVFTSHQTGGVESRTADLIAGKLDFTYGSAMNDINIAKNVIQKNTNYSYAVLPSTYQRQFYFNLVGPKTGKYDTDMRKVEVRQAINLLIDKDAIANLYAGQATPLTSWVNTQSSAYDSDIPLWSRNVDKAKQMLQEAGFDFSKSIRLLYYYDDQLTKDLMDTLVQQFAQAGVKLEPFLITGDVGNIVYTVKEWDMMYAGNGGGSDPILTYQTIIPDGGSCDGLFGDVDARNSTLGKIFEEYKATTDPKQKKEFGDQLQVEANKSMYIIPIYALNEIYIYNSSKLYMDPSILKVCKEVAYNMKFNTWELKSN